MIFIKFKSPDNVSGIPNNRFEIQGIIVAGLTRSEGPMSREPMMTGNGKIYNIQRTIFLLNTMAFLVLKSAMQPRQGVTGNLLD